MWNILKPRKIPSNMSEIDYVRLTEEREAYRSEIQLLKAALSDALEEMQMWRREAMKNITR